MCIKITSRNWCYGNSTNCSSFATVFLRNFPQNRKRFVLFINKTLKNHENKKTSASFRKYHFGCKITAICSISPRKLATFPFFTLLLLLFYVESWAPLILFVCLLDCKFATFTFCVFFSGLQICCFYFLCYFWATIGAAHAREIK